MEFPRIFPDDFPVTVKLMSQEHLLRESDSEILRATKKTEESVRTPRSNLGKSRKQPENKSENYWEHIKKTKDKH